MLRCGCGYGDQSLERSPLSVLLVTCPSTLLRAVRASNGPPRLVTCSRPSAVGGLWFFFFFPS
jgi:hypothetical protein